jgi:methanethiol S-methyltransferase
MKYLLIASLWIGYCTLHSLLISISFTNLMTRLLKKYYGFYRLFYVIISFVLLIPLINLTNQMDNIVIITYPYLLNIIRYVLAYGSLLMFLWAFIFDYDVFSFFGVRQIMNIGKTKRTDRSNEIKKKGLLGLMRHPMYLALIIYLWCQIFREMDILVNLILTIYIIIGTFLEERKLILEFGDSYIQYQKEVPMLIPFTKRKIK